MSHLRIPSTILKTKHILYREFDNICSTAVTYKSADSFFESYDQNESFLLHIILELVILQVLT
jgi:hypothetical protein